MARINKNGKIFVLVSNGKLIENTYSNNQLPFVFGNPDIVEFFNIKKIHENLKFLMKKLKIYIFFYLKDGI